MKLSLSIFEKVKEFMPNIQWTEAETNTLLHTFFNRRFNSNINFKLTYSTQEQQQIEQYQIQNAFIVEGIMQSRFNKNILTTPHFYKWLKSIKNQQDL